MYQSWSTPWPVVWPAVVRLECQGEACGATWLSSAAGWTRPPSKGSGRLRTQQPVRCVAPERWWKPLKEPGDTEDLFCNCKSTQPGELEVSWSVAFTSSGEMCLAMRSLRLVLSLALSDCLYCHFSGAKGHFISTASCRREASSGHKSGWKNCVSLFIKMSETGSETQWGTSLSCNFFSRLFRHVGDVVLLSNPRSC